MGHSSASILFLLAIAYAGVGAVLSADAYPKSFPFDNEYGEGLPDLNLPDATPSYTYTTTDNGGYSKLKLSCDWAAEMAKDVLYGADGKEVAKGRSALGLNVTQPKTWTPYFCPGAQYVSKNYLIDANADVSKIKVQCTVGKAMKQQWDTKWASSISAGTKKSFSGYLGQSILPSGEIDPKVTECTDCCKKFNQDDFDHNKRAGIRAWVPPTSALSTTQNFLRSDSCSISLGEAAKCFAIEWPNVQCVQNYISGNKRSFTYPCPDLFLRHYYSCKLRMAAARVEGAPEPPKYASKTSAKVSTSLFALQRGDDKVCQPYSYYYPALAKPAGSTDYYSPGSPLGKNDPSGGAPSGTPTGSSNPPSSTAAWLRIGTGLLLSVLYLTL